MICNSDGKFSKTFLHCSFTHTPIIYQPNYQPTHKLLFFESTYPPTSLFNYHLLNVIKK
jgi:hypothetical protein